MPSKTNQLERRPSHNSVAKGTSGSDAAEEHCWMSRQLPIHCVLARNRFTGSCARENSKRPRSADNGG